MIMNNIKYYGIILMILLSSCGSPGWEMYRGHASIYMNLPFAQDEYGNELSYRVDSLTYTFAYKENNIKEDTLWIPVEMEGFRVGYDRSFQVRVVDGTVVEGKDYKLLKDLCIIKANEGKGNIPLLLYRTVDLKEGSKRIKLALENNSDFKADYIDLSDVIVSFSDVLVQPDWWNLASWKLGNYHYIKHQEFIRISGLKEFDIQYYAGHVADMFYYFGLLKQYFIDNERYELEEYPDAPGYPGNRILLP